MARRHNRLLAAAALALLGCSDDDPAAGTGGSSPTSTSSTSSAPTTSTSTSSHPTDAGAGGGGGEVGPRVGILFEDGIEDPDFPVRTGVATTGWNDVGQPYDESAYCSLERTDVQARRFGHSARFELQRAPYPDNTEPRNLGCELGWNQTGPGEPLLDLSWLALSVMLEEPFEPEAAPELVSFDLRDDNVDGEEDWQSPMGIWTRDGLWQVVLCADPVADDVVTPSCETYEVGPHEAGVWVDWVIHRNWSPGDNGFVQVWKDGVRVVDVTGPNFYADAFIGPEPYVKVGIDKWSWSDAWDPAWGESFATTRAIYVDEIRFATSEASYDDVRVR